MNTIIYNNINAVDTTARKLACTNFINDFNSNDTTIEAMQQYSRCVNMLYPTNTPDVIFYVKLFIVMMISSAIINIAYNHIRGEYFGGDYYSDEYVYNGIIGLLIGMVSWLVLISLIFLFKA